MPGKILIVDDLATNRIILKVKLNAAYHETIMAASGHEALQRARQEKPTLILLDLVLPDLSGIEVCRRLRSDPETRHIPIVIITANSDRDSRLRALSAGADEFLSKPLNEVILLARIRSLLRAHQTETELRSRSETWGDTLGGTLGDMALHEGPTPFEQPALIGLVAENTPNALAWRAALAPHLQARTIVMSPQEALSLTAGKPVPDCFLLATDAGGKDGGLRLVADLRSRDATRFSALALTLSNPDPARAAMALDLGANDLISLPWDAEETALRLHLHITRKRRADTLRDAVTDGLRMAVVDPLTGVYNRRFGLAHLDRIAERAQSEQRRFAVIMLDLDRFKAINDTYGHGAGDAVLSGVAQTLQDALRPSDLLARIGGEEFMVVLPDATEASAARVADRLRDAVSQLVTQAGPGIGDLRITISAGIALGPPAIEPWRSLDDKGPCAASTMARAVLNQADRALLSAKSQGRNQVRMTDAA